MDDEVGSAPPREESTHIALGVVRKQLHGCIASWMLANAERRYSMEMSSIADHRVDSRWFTLIARLSSLSFQIRLM
jgi:hypothetical protein